MFQVTGYVAAPYTKENSRPLDSGAFLQRFRSDEEFVIWLNGKIENGCAVIISHIQRS